MTAQPYKPHLPARALVMMMAVMMVYQQKTIMTKAAIVMMKMMMMMMFAWQCMQVAFPQSKGWARIAAIFKIGN